MKYRICEKVKNACSLYRKKRLTLRLSRPLFLCSESSFFAYSNVHLIGRLASVINGARFTHDTDFNLPWIIKTLLDLVSDITGELISCEFVDLLWFDNNTHLAPGLDRKGFLHAGKRV